MKEQPNAQAPDRQADNRAAQTALKAKIAQIAVIPPHGRTPAQNAELQSLEQERQALIEQGETLAGDVG